MYHFSSVQSLSCVWLFATPWTATHQASLSFTISWSLLKLMSMESMIPPNHLILCLPLLLLPSVFPSIRVFSNESALHIRWQKYWSFSIRPSNKYWGLISFRTGLIRGCIGREKSGFKGGRRKVWSTGRKWDLGLEVNERPLGWFPVAAVTLGLRQLAFISSQCWRSEVWWGPGWDKVKCSREVPSVNPGEESFPSF